MQLSLQMFRQCLFPRCLQHMRCRYVVSTPARCNRRRWHIQESLIKSSIAKKIEAYTGNVENPPSVLDFQTKSWEYIWQLYEYHPLSINHDYLPTLLYQNLKTTSLVTMATNPRLSGFPNVPSTVPTLRFRKVAVVQPVTFMKMTTCTQKIHF